VSETKEQWFSRELLTARLAKERYEPITRDTLVALICLIDDTVVGRVSGWQAKIRSLEDELRELKYGKGVNDHSQASDAGESK
jgi:hypothetical protein